MAELTRHSGHLPILSNNQVLWSSHHWIYPYPSAVYSIPAACFSSHVSRLLGKTKGQCIVIFVQIYRGLIKYSIYRGSPISSQIARHFFRLGLTQLERGHKRPFETLDYPIGNPSTQCRNLGFRTSSQCFDLNTMWCPLRSTSICQAPLQPMCYSSAFCWGVLSAVSSCRTPLLKNFYKFPLRCTPSTGTKSLY